MTYQELVEEARKIFGRADAGVIDGHVAYQFNVAGEAEGAFYLEIDNGVVHVEPYEYYDRDVLFTTSADTLLKIAGGKLDPVWAYTTGKLKLEGSVEKALLLKKLADTVKENVEAEEEKAEASVEEKTETPAAEKAEAPTEETEAPAAEKKINLPGGKKSGRGKKRR